VRCGDDYSEHDDKTYRSAADDPCRCRRGIGTRESATEQYAVMLDRFGKTDTARFVQGITHYAEAKADFDGLIEALKTDLVQRRDPTTSSRFGEALRVAAEKRIAFTSFVEEVIGNKEGAKGWIYDAIRVVPDLVRALTDAGVTIWREFHDARKARRDQILNQIDHLKWKAFADIVKT
jgi:hypothetical protein